MLKKYVLLVLSLIGIANAPLKAMESEKAPVKVSEADAKESKKSKPKTITIIDGQGCPCVIDAVLLEHSKTLKEFFEDNPSAQLDFSQAENNKNEWLSGPLLNLMAQALYHRNYSPFWEKLSADELHAMHKAEDYLHISVLCKPITKWLLKKDPRVGKPYVSLLVANRYYESTLANHTLHIIPSVKSIVKKEPIVCDAEAQRIDLSNKGLISLKGLEKIPFDIRKKCEVLDISGNNLGTLNTDIIWDNLPNLTMLIAEKAQVIQVKGTRRLPDGVVLLLAHNKISQFDSEILKGSQRCFIDVNNNEMSEVLLQDLQNQVNQISIKEKIRRNIIQPFVLPDNGLRLFTITNVLGFVICCGGAYILATDPVYIKKPETIITTSIAIFGFGPETMREIQLDRKIGGTLDGVKVVGEVIICDVVKDILKIKFDVPSIDLNFSAAMRRSACCLAMFVPFTLINYNLLRKLVNWANRPAIASYMKNNDQLPITILNKKHILCAAAKMKQAVANNKQEDGGLEVLVRE